MPDPDATPAEPAFPGREEVGGLLESFRPRLQRMLALRLDPRLRSRVDPEDVLQEAFAEVVGRFDDYRAARPMPFFVWVRFLTAQRLAKVHRRHLGAARRDAGREVGRRAGPAASSESLALAMGAEGPSPSTAVARLELYDRVRAAIDGLAAEDREVVALRFFERLSNEETAAVLGLSASGVSKRLASALLRLRRELPRAEDVPTP